MKQINVFANFKTIKLATKFAFMKLVSLNRQTHVTPGAILMIYGRNTP